MWKFLAILVHILLLGYLTQIYFKSSIINVRKTQVGHRELGLEPPADRLVIFLVNGLRAESLFRDDYSAVPNLKSIFMKHGLKGISRSGAPSESRPGHIALLGGFREDASVALRNFKSNPMAFDTVLNRTKGDSWVWGPKSALQFLKILPNGGHAISFDMHTPADISSSNSPHQWIYDRVRKFLAVSAESRKLSSVFLLEFDDLYHNGIPLKPNSKAFRMTLNNTENIIAKLHDLFEHHYSDGRTVYLLTSDHGMSDEGTHGGDSQLEGETPFIFWGAGVDVVDSPFKMFVLPETKANPVQLHTLKQIQLAPFMSALIGLPPPKNNHAMLPLGLMNVSKNYEAHSLYLNARQILAQVEHVMDVEERSYIRKWLPRFKRLDRHDIMQFQENFKAQMLLESVDEAMMGSQSMIKMAWEYLDYYRLYYRIPLMIACILTYLGWLCYLLAKQARPTNAPKQDLVTVINIILLLLEALVAIICVLHSVPCGVSFFLLVPLPVWALAFHERGSDVACMNAPVIQLAWISATVVLIIATFFYKPLIALAYLIMVCVNNGRAFTRSPNLKFWIWLALVAILTGFTAKRPEFVYNSFYLLYLGMVVTLLRPIVLNEQHAIRVWVINIAALLLGGYMVYERVHNQETCCVLQGAAWLYVFYALISIPYSDTKTPRHRLQLILFNLSTVYSLMCISYEAIYMQLLCTEFLLGMHVLKNTKFSISDDSTSVEEDEEEEEKPEKALSPEEHIHKIYSYAVLILVYTYFSMVGTGTLLDLNSLNASFARIFVSDCSIVLIGALYVLKMMIPVVIIMCSLYTIQAHARQNLRGIFICIFLICDVLSLYFFFFVRTKGSWQSIRCSLSQQLIIHGMPMLFALFSWLPKQLLSAIPLTLLPMLTWKSSVKMSQSGQTQV